MSELDIQRRKLQELTVSFDSEMEKFSELKRQVVNSAKLSYQAAVSLKVRYYEAWGGGVQRLQKRIDAMSRKIIALEKYEATRKSGDARGEEPDAIIPVEEEAKGEGENES